MPDTDGSNIAALFERPEPVATITTRKESELTKQRGTAQFPGSKPPA
jgi:hypothetical protein